MAKAKNSQAIISSPENGHRLMQMAKWRGFREQTGGGKSKLAEFSADHTPRTETPRQPETWTVSQSALLLPQSPRPALLLVSVRSYVRLSS